MLNFIDQITATEYSNRTVATLDMGGLEIEAVVFYNGNVKYLFTLVCEETGHRISETSA